MWVWPSLKVRLIAIELYAVLISTHQVTVVPNFLCVITYTTQNIHIVIFSSTKPRPLRAGNVLLKMIHSCLLLPTFEHLAVTENKLVRFVFQN